MHLLRDLIAINLLKWRVGSGHLLDDDRCELILQNPENVNLKIRIYKQVDELLEIVGKKINWTDKATDDQLNELLVKGKTFPQIAKIMGVSKDSVAGAVLRRRNRCISGTNHDKT